MSILSSNTMMLLMFFLDARTLFGRAVTSLPPDRSRPLWDCWARYEYQFGSLEAALILERRMLEVFPSGECRYLRMFIKHQTNLFCIDTPIKHFADRYIYFGTDTVAVRDLGFVSGRSARPSRYNAKSNTLNSAVSAQPSGHPRASAQSVEKRPLSDHGSRGNSRSNNDGPSAKRTRISSPGIEHGSGRWDSASRQLEPSSPQWNEPEGPRQKHDKQTSEGDDVSHPPNLPWFI